MPAIATIASAPLAAPLPPGFIGLSSSTTRCPRTRDDPAAVDPVFEQLVRNLSPGQAPVLRIGGDSTD